MSIQIGKIMSWPRSHRNMGARPYDRVRRSISVGGVVVSAFSMLGDMLRPVYTHGADYAAGQTWAMTAGAVALAAYGGAVCHILIRARFRVESATLVAVVVWLVVAFGLLAFAEA
jgi:hypothetical protein